MKLKALGLAGLAVAMYAAPALAHHSFAMFDSTQQKLIEGEVVEWNYNNPHSWLHVRAPDAKGEMTTWSFEGAAIVHAARQGVNGTTYQFRVAAVTAVGFGPYASIIASPFTTPNAPQNPGVVNGNESVTLSWTQPANNGSPITQYRIDLCTTNITSCTEYGRTIGAGNTSFTATGLHNFLNGGYGNPWWVFRVAAVNAAGLEAKVVDVEAFHEGVGRMLAEVQRIKSTGDYAAAAALFDTYGITDANIAKQASWGTTRDNLVLGGGAGGIDGAHILTPKPYQISLGTTTPENKPVPMYILCRLNYDCQAISVAKEFKGLGITVDEAALKKHTLLHEVIKV